MWYPKILFSSMQSTYYIEEIDKTSYVWRHPIKWREP